MNSLLFFLLVVLIVPWTSHGKNQNQRLYDIVVDDAIEFDSRRGLLSPSETTTTTTLHFYALGDVPYTTPEWTDPGLESQC